MPQVLQPSRQAAWVTLISPSAPGNAGAGSLRGRAVRPGWADCWILLRQAGSAWGFQEMRNRRAGPGGGWGGAGVDGPGGGELVGGAGVPADPDPYFAAVRFGQQGDVGDQGAQQPLAVLGGGGAGVPEGGQVGGEFLQVSPAGQRR